MISQENLTTGYSLSIPPDVTIDCWRWTIEVNGRGAIRIPPEEFFLLTYLAAWEGVARSVEQIVRDGLQERPVGRIEDRARLKMIVHRIRRALDLPPQRLIHTVLGYGYVLIAEPIRLEGAA